MEANFVRDQPNNVLLLAFNFIQPLLLNDVIFALLDDAVSVINYSADVYVALNSVAELLSANFDLIRICLHASLLVCVNLPVDVS